MHISSGRLIVAFNCAISPSDQSIFQAETQLENKPQDAIGKDIPKAIAGEKERGSGQEGISLH